VSAWTESNGSPGVGLGAVTLVEGSSFCVCAATGDMVAHRPHGVFFRDTRIVSRWDLTVDDEPVEALAAMTPEPFRATFVGRAPRRNAGPDSPLLVHRDRRVGTGMREDIVLRNLSREPAGCLLTIAVDADFADVFDVKEGRVRRRGQRTSLAEGNRLVLSYHWRDKQRGVVVQAEGASVVTAELISYRVVVPPRGEWTATLLVRPIVDGEELATRFPVDRPVDESEPARQLQAWRHASPVAEVGDEAIEEVLRWSQRDLGALRIFDPDFPDRAVVAAGAPWFMALFGRDSLLTSWMALPIDQSLALGTLQTLARYQGSKEDPLTEEEPGRILHEVRLGVDTTLVLGGGTIYYGTVDATPLFVMLLGELRRWGLSRDEVDDLLPNADRALDWIRRYGDRDGDGFVEYRRATDQGLVNQGWKDSWDGINFADGRLPEAPIALCEVQGYVYCAYLARAQFAAEAGDDEQARSWTTRAEDLKRSFNESFWLPDRGWYAVALDRDKNPVDALASNMGHCLWTGIVDEDKAAQVAKRLMSPEMFTGWGVRTLATGMDRYNPVSYHNGSVWPHDNAIIAGGLLRYGFVKEAQQIAQGLFDAAAAFDDRLPELFCGFDRADYPEPVPYPTSCSPQAWASASPIHLLRSLLRFEPMIPHGKVWLAPVLPDEFRRLRVRNVPLAGFRVDLDARRERGEIRGLPPDIEVVHAPLGAATPLLPTR